MQYNIIPNSLYYVNTDIGNKNLNFKELSDIVNYSDTPISYLEDGDVLVIDIDLGLRISLSKLKYKFYSSSLDYDTVVSGIEFFYKNEVLDQEYISLNTSIDDEQNVYSTTVSGYTLAPRYIRLKHTLNTVSGTVYGIYISNNDTIVNFGEDGGKTSDTIELSRYEEKITELPIYNSGTTMANAVVSIEPTYTDFDQTISISDSVDGPWSFPLDSDYVLLDDSNFNYGVHDNTYITDSNNIKISNVITYYGATMFKYLPGYYYTKIFDHSDNIRSEIDLIKTNSAGRIAVDLDDTIDTIEVRSSNIKPKTYSFYRYVVSWYSGSTTYFRIRDCWRDGTIFYDGPSFHQIINKSDMDDYETVIAKYSDRTAGWITTHDTYSTINTRLFLFNIKGTSYKTTILSETNVSDSYIDSEIYNIKLEKDGGLWAYFYCRSYNSSDFVDRTGYYLVHFSYSLSNTFKSYETTKKINALDVDYDTTEIWYSNKSAKTLYKMNSYGSIISYYESAANDITNDIGDLSVIGNSSGTWFSNGSDLHKVNSNCTELLDSMFNVVETLDIKIIETIDDNIEKLWLYWGSKVGLLNISGDRKGEFDFYIEVQNVTSIDPVKEGCWLKLDNFESKNDDKYQFLSIENKRLENWYKPSGHSKPIAKEIYYTDAEYTELMDTLQYNPWTDLEWKKIYLKDYLFSEDKYTQFKITMRVKEASELYEGVDSFTCCDTFVQNSSVPKNVLWSDWRDKSVGDGLNRVYIDTDNNELVLTRLSGAYDSYINTKYRMITSLDADHEFEASIDYRIGDGNVYPSGTGKDENLYLRFYSVDDSHVEDYMFARIFIPADGSYFRLYFGHNNSSTYYNSSSYKNKIYENTLKIFNYRYNNINYICALLLIEGVWVGYSTYTGYKVSDAGTYFYAQIISQDYSSNMYIKNFEITKGNVYYNTDSPVISSLISKNQVKVQNIYPNNFKNIYIKNSVPNDINIGSNYDINIKTRWEIPVI